MNEVFLQKGENSIQKKNGVGGVRSQCAVRKVNKMRIHWVLWKSLVTRQVAHKYNSRSELRTQEMEANRLCESFLNLVLKWRNLDVC